MDREDRCSSLMEDQVQFPDRCQAATALALVQCLFDLEWDLEDRCHPFQMALQGRQWDDRPLVVQAVPVGNLGAPDYRLFPPMVWDHVKPCDARLHPTFARRRTARLAVDAPRTKARMAVGRSSAHARCRARDRRHPSFHRP